MSRMEEPEKHKMVSTEHFSGGHQERSQNNEILRGYFPSNLQIWQLLL